MRRDGCSRDAASPRRCDVGSGHEDPGVPSPGDTAARSNRRRRRSARARISGKVIAADTGAPIRRAQVTLSAARSSQKMTYTDTRGGTSSGTPGGDLHGHRESGSAPRRYLPAATAYAAVGSRHVGRSAARAQSRSNWRTDSSSTTSTSPSSAARRDLRHRHRRGRRSRRPGADWRAPGQTRNGTRRWSAVSLPTIWASSGLSALRQGTTS